MGSTGFYVTVCPRRHGNELRFERLTRRCQKLSSEAWNWLMHAFLTAHRPFHIYPPYLAQRTSLIPLLLLHQLSIESSLLAFTMPSSTHSPSPSSNHKSRKRRSKAKSLPTRGANEQDRDGALLKRCNSFPVAVKVAFTSSLQADL